MTTTTIEEHQIQYDEQKFTELLLYVTSRLVGDPSNGSVKLNKVLFFADFFTYKIRGTPITGATYVKHPLGPAPRGIRSLQQRLIENGEADLAVVLRGTQYQKLLFAKREPDLSLFDGSEIAAVDAVIEGLASSNMREVSNMSHTLLGWRVAEELGVIPYCAALLYDGPLTVEDVLHGRSLASRLRSELENAGHNPGDPAE
jgi:hypothetical protein